MRQGKLPTRQSSGSLHGDNRAAFRVEDDTLTIKEGALDRPRSTDLTSQEFDPGSWRIGHHCPSTFGEPGEEARRANPERSGQVESSIEGLNPSTKRHFGELDRLRAVFEDPKNRKRDRRRARSGAIGEPEQARPRPSNPPIRARSQTKPPSRKSFHSNEFASDASAAASTSRNSFRALCIARSVAAFIFPCQDHLV